MNPLNSIKNIYFTKIQHNEFFAPRIIHVETRSKCNGSCSFCPASVKTETRDDILMPFEYIEKIIYELNNIRYNNRLSFYNNNEPFLDKRIYEIVNLARNKLPGTYLELKTNGLILTVKDIFKIFDAGLDMLYINDYSSTGNHHKNIYKINDELKKVRRFKGHFENGTYYRRVVITLRDIDSIGGTARAGNNPQKPVKKILSNSICLRPIEMMTINPKGDVAICSEDVFSKINMGNIRQNDLINIWASDTWNKFRLNLLNGDRLSHPVCSKCDNKGYTQEILMENGVFKKNRAVKYLSRMKRKIKEQLK